MTVARTKPVKPVRSRRLYWLAAALGVVLVALAVYVWRAQAGSGELVGAGIVDPATPAPDFSLTDQNGQQVSLSSLRGKPIALTFIYTHCPDACPIIASNMHAAYLRLKGDASRVAMVAVTVDPEHDDVAAIRQFSADRGLVDEWHFTTGTRPQLQQVWTSYGIYSQTVDASGAPATPSANQPDQVEHSSPVFLIDKKGNVRALLPIDFTADNLATDLSRLLNES